MTLLDALWNCASPRGVPIDNFEHKYYHCKCAASQLGVNIVLCHRPAGDGTVWWRPIVHNLIGRRACVAVDAAAAADAKQMRAISAGGAGSIRPDIKLNCRTEERAAGEQCDQVP